MSSFSKITTPVWAILVTLFLVGIVVFVISQKSRKWTARMISTGALCIALSFILSYIKLYELPQGGSITLASMLPILLFAYTYGVGPGFVVGIAYGILEFIQGPYFLSFTQFLLDYPLAFAMLGLCGLSKKFSKSWGFIPGIILAIFGRFVCAFLSGVIFYGAYAPEGQNVLIYSAVYNGTYLIPEAAICIAISAVPQVRSLVDRLSFNNGAYR